MVISERPTVQNPLVKTSENWKLKIEFEREYYFFTQNCIQFFLQFDWNWNRKSSLKLFFLQIIRISIWFYFQFYFQFYFILQFYFFLNFFHSRFSRPLLQPLLQRHWSPRVTCSSTHRRCLQRCSTSHVPQSPTWHRCLWKSTRTRCSWTLKGRWRRSPRSSGSLSTQSQGRPFAHASRKQNSWEAPFPHESWSCCVCVLWPFLLVVAYFPFFSQ